MTYTPRGPLAACLLSVLVACSRTPEPAPAPEPTPGPVAGAPAPATQPPAPKPESGHEHHMTGLPAVKIPQGAIYTEADVHFMQGMIAHHAQAIHMSQLAASRGASPRLVKLAQKIDLSQMGEIVLMQEWLRENGQVAPDTSSWRTMTMAGMLTTEELSKLSAARGQEFDRLFLVYMIKHHEGALRMVEDLFRTPRAAQDVDVSVLANDVENVQTAEIALMRQMLIEM